MDIITIRDFAENSLNTLMSLIKIFFFPKGDKIIPFEPKNREVLILGNGPSLASFLKKSFNQTSSKDLLCVNYFGRTAEFTKLKPAIYVICSPEYFIEDEKKEFAIERQRTLDAIAENTTWDLIFCVPSIAKKNIFWAKKFKNHPHIKIFYMATTPIKGFRIFENWAFSQNMGMPRPHNVLIPAILLAINLRYNKIEIAGADHSWLSEIIVNKENEVLLSQKHFYDKEAAKQKHYRDMSVPQSMYKGSSTDARKLHEVLEKFYYTFRSYWTLSSYAEYRRVEIVNITPDSYIDAFKKRTLDDLTDEQSTKKPS